MSRLHSVNTWNLYKTLGDLDLFKVQPPTFNIRGKTHVSSAAGGLVSLLVVTVMLIYAAHKFVDFMERKNPLIQTFT